ncbi:MAG: hypothetical protein ACXVC0_02530, partial [Bdellovibrionota bacterium]
MKRENQVFIAVPLVVGLLFWEAQFALLVIPLLVLFFCHSKGLFRLFWRMLIRQRGAPVALGIPPQSGVDSEPTLITMVSRAPNQLLGVDQDAGTGTIFRSFHRQVKEEQIDGLRLNKKGRRLTAAKNAMLSQRRKRGRPASTPATRTQGDLKNSLRALLEDRPVFQGKVIQFTNLSPSVKEEYQVGVEIEELGLTGICGDHKPAARSGSSRFVIQSQSGR